MNYTEIASRLAGWHAAQQRSLPWRDAPAGQRDPYAVWVSEVMAQQTRLSTVVDYYNRWMQRFPTVQEVARADLQEVLKLWEGLGYYARARNLHRAAQVVVAEHGGALPPKREDLLQLPGIGEYTAGAILSLAYGQRAPILDGNVKRVFSRLDNIVESIDDRATVKKLWGLARKLVEEAPDGRVGAVNEGLMELGALVCTPTAPRCLLCPVAPYCEANKQGLQAERPVRNERRTTPHFDVTAGVIWEGEPLESRMLIAQRPEDGMLGGLWEFPGGKLEAHDEGLEQCLRREIREELGISIDVLAPVTTVRHAYTHFRITLHAFHARHSGGIPQALHCADWRWITWQDLAAMPFPVTDQQIIQALQADMDARAGKTDDSVGQK